MKGSWLIKIGMLLMTTSFIMTGIKHTNQALNDFNNDYLLGRVIVQSTEETYEVFKNKLDTYREDITKFYGSLDFYYDQFVEKHKEIKQYLDTVEKDYDDLIDSSKKLFDNCKYDINDVNLKDKCEAYKTNLNNVVSSHSKLIEDYNDILNMYNDYAKSNNKQTMEKYENKSNDELSRINRELDK